MWSYFLNVTHITKAFRVSSAVLSENALSATETGFIEAQK